MKRVVFKTEFFKEHLRVLLNKYKISYTENELNFYIDCTDEQYAMIMKLLAERTRGYII